MAQQEIATLAGGCFWCLEAVFDMLRGVQSVESGYIAGKVPNPTYEQVCTGRTGHAEAIRITFDPTVISFKQLLDVFFTVHDPTTRDRQGADVGSQYRSGVYFYSPEQKATADAAIAELNDAHLYPGPLVTEVLPADKFYVAEGYHQEYYANNPYQPYCRAVVAPKVAKARKVFLDQLRDTAKQPQA